VSWWSHPVLQGEAVKIFLASVPSDICAVWPNRENAVLGHSPWIVGIPSQVKAITSSSFLTVFILANGIYSAKKLY